jgi:hypothetical protein
VAPLRVRAFSVVVAVVAAIRAFIYVDTTGFPMTSAMVTIVACALVTSIDIATRCLSMTIVRSFFTLIDVLTALCIVWLG